MPRPTICCLLTTGFLMMASLQPCRGGEPLLEKTELFVAGQGGYETYRIPSLVVTPKGTLLAFCEARKTTSDWAPIDIIMRRSTDEGKNWSELRIVGQVEGPHRKNPAAIKQNLSDAGTTVTQNNPLAIADAMTGAVHLLFCHEYLRCFYRRSDDDGQSFTEPVEITASLEPFREVYDWKALATGPGHGVQLASGRLIVPVWLSTGTGGNAHRPSVATTIYSDDHGATWQCGEIAAGETDPLINPCEAEAVELADGRVLLNIRNESKQNRRAVAISPDGATQWTRPVFDDELVEPICMASICRLSKQSTGGKNRILFSNPDNLERTDGRKAQPGENRDRKNLTVKLSYDEAQSWPLSKTLEAGPSAYSDLAIGPDGTIYCLYERGNGMDDRSVDAPSLILARFNLEWLSDGKDKLTAAPAGR